MTSENFFFAAIIDLKFFVWACALQIFFYSNFFFGIGEGLKLGLYVLYHNNNFNLINIYSTKTLMFCFAVFFSQCCVCKIFFYALLGICKFFFYKFFPPPPPRDQLVRPLKGNIHIS